MNTVSVIPITRGITKKELTYYTNEPVSPGDIVSIPLRNKEVPALVTEITSVKTQKALLRSAKFSVRKISSVHTRAFFSPAFIHSIENTVSYFAATPGTVLNTLVPKDILTTSVVENSSPTLKKTHTISALQDEEEVRVAHHKSLVRELFAKKQSLIILFPTRIEAETMFLTLSRGIEKRSILLHTGFTKRKKLELWTAALSSRQPLLIVTTPQFLSLPRNDIGTIIVEHEHSRYYKTASRPYIDLRTFAEFLSQAMSIPLILSSELLRLETLWRVSEGVITPINKPRLRYITKTVSTIADMRPYTKASEYGFKTISNELVQLLQSSKSPSDRICVFSLRKGLYPLTVCSDCGELVTCTRCSTPVVVHPRTSRDSNVFVCHRCSTIRSAKEHCAVCKSWNLTTLGVGSTRVANEIASLLPEKHVIYINPDEMTPGQIKKGLTRWYKTPAGILVGTETILPYLEPVTHVAVASMDTLFSLPDFRATERLLRTLLFLRARATQTFTIQTRNPDHPIFTYARDGNIQGWYQEEIQERKKMNYPPFTKLIKITTTGSAHTVKKNIALLENTLKVYDPQSFSAFASRVRGKYVMHTLITLKPNAWPNAELCALLQDLSPHYTVHIDPETLM